MLAKFHKYSESREMLKASRSDSSPSGPAQLSQDQPLGLSAGPTRLSARSTQQNMITITLTAGTTNEIFKLG
jgi:hypothetical protein